MASETKGEEENGDCIILTINNKKDIPIKIGGVHFWCVFDFLHDCTHVFGRAVAKPK